MVECNIIIYFLSGIIIFLCVMIIILRILEFKKAGELRRILNEIEKRTFKEWRELMAEDKETEKGNDYDN